MPLFTRRFLWPLKITPTHFALRRSGFHLHRATPPLCQIPLGDMLQLRRSIIYLWTLAPRGGGDGNGDGTRSQTPRSVVEGVCHPEMVGSSRAVIKRGRNQKEEDDSSASGMRHYEPQPPPKREVRLSFISLGGTRLSPPRGLVDRRPLGPPPHQIAPSSTWCVITSIPPLCLRGR